MYFKTDNVMPELVASKDESRPVLTKIHLDTERAEVLVSDSIMAACFPVVVEEGDTSGPIPLDALKASRKPPLKNCPETSIAALNFDVQVKMGRGEDASAPYVTVPRESSDYTFPNLREVFPDSFGAFEIAIDVDKLLALAKSFGNKGYLGRVVRLRFCEVGGELSNLRPVSVRPLHGGEDAPSAILMPCRIGVALGAHPAHHVIPSGGRNDE